MKNLSFVCQDAKPIHIANIISLYNTAYDGKYPDPIFSNYGLLKEELEAKNKKLFVAIDTESNEVIASVSFMYDPINLIAKASSAVVSPDAQGHNLTKILLEYGIKDIQDKTKGLALVYITTRTVHKVAQILTEKMGFKKLGIFPNAHKTVQYETHALAGLYFDDSLAKRFTNFKQHPLIAPLFQLAALETNLPKMEVAEDWIAKSYKGKAPVLELISAKEYVLNKYLRLKEKGEIDLGFFPFHKPTSMITSADDKIQVFLNINIVDNHSVITGVKIDREVSFTELFLKVSNMLRDLGVRYIEMIVRANRLNIIDKMIDARFIPCGYVPGFQLENDLRYDYAVFSRSFEILDFNNIELSGTNESFLKEYIKTWSKVSLGNKFNYGSFDDESN